MNAPLLRIQSYADDLTAIRHDLHAHPELGFEEVRTSGIVAGLLRDWGIAVTTGLAKTGVVGVIEGNRPGRCIGLRADMDALPIEERSNLAFASKTPGVMHACGHDGHTAMLLGAARYLAETRNFAGRVVLIFQPAEEGLGGARAMIDAGLFDKFPCDEIYGMHNSPYHAPGKVGVKPGAAMAGADFFDITVQGVGSHAARPQSARDPIIVAGELVGALQSIVSRNVDPQTPAILSITQVHAGTAYNVIPDTATLTGTVRFMDPAVGAMVAQRIRDICAGVALAHGVDITVDIRNVFDVLENDAALCDAVVTAARDVAAADMVGLKDELTMGSEDFADMLRVVPGAFFTVGHAGDVALHNPSYTFDDTILPLGASIFARLVETRGAETAGKDI